MSDDQQEHLEEFRDGAVKAREGSIVIRRLGHFADIHSYTPPEQKERLKAKGWTFHGG